MFVCIWHIYTPLNTIRFITSVSLSVYIYAFMYTDNISWPSLHHRLNEYITAHVTYFRKGAYYSCDLEQRWNYHSCCFRQWYDSSRRCPNGAMIYIHTYNYVCIQVIHVNYSFFKRYKYELYWMDTIGAVSELLS